MKKDFATSWKKSIKPRKQRKYRFNAPYHTSGKFLSANLSKELRSRYGIRSLRVKKGDKIKVMRGQHKSKIGNVERVSVKYSKIYVNGIENIKKDGTKNLVPFEPSNIQIIELDTTDKKRLSTINEKGSAKSGSDKSVSDKSDSDKLVSNDNQDKK